MRGIGRPLTLGRVFRRMGLPMWTFLGIGVSGIWFTYGAALLEKGLRDWIGVDETTRGWVTYVSPLTLFLLPVGMVAAAWAYQSASYRLTRMRFPGAGLPQPEGRKGLILLVSNELSAMFAVRYHFVDRGTLERVWLIPSNDTEGEKFGGSSRSIAEKIQEACAQLAQEEDRTLEVEIHRTGVSPADAQDTFDSVNRIFRDRRYEPGEIIADFTGGTKPMSVGMIMACLPADRELEYVSYNPQTRQSSGPFLIDYQHSAFDLVG
jgi:hypothetical protein